MPPPPSSDATLSALTVGPTDIIGFDPDRTDYEVGGRAHGDPGHHHRDRQSPGRLGSVQPHGHRHPPLRSNSSAGRNVVTVTVTSEDGSATRDYTVSVNRGVTADYGWKAALDLDGLIAAGNFGSSGIWSDGDTMWVTDWEDDKIYAYNTDGTREQQQGLQHAQRGKQQRPVRHLVRRRHHVGGRFRRRDALRL